VLVLSSWVGLTSLAGGLHSPRAVVPRTNNRTGSRQSPRGPVPRHLPDSLQRIHA
jgi:hypothetical protein